MGTCPLPTESEAYPTCLFERFNPPCQCNCFTDKTTQCLSHDEIQDGDSCAHAKGDFGYFDGPSIPSIDTLAVRDAKNRDESGDTCENDQKTDETQYGKIE
jgi:hypothetical protein